MMAFPLFQTLSKIQIWLIKNAFQGIETQAIWNRLLQIKYKTKNGFILIDTMFTKTLLLKILWLKRNTVGLKVYCFQLLWNQK